MKLVLQIAQLLGLMAWASAIANLPADADVRLVNGATPNEGRVEIFHNGMWGTICDDHFGTEEAQVVCRQLGYGASVAIPIGTVSFYGQGSGPIWLDDISCTSSESNLGECNHLGWGNHDCWHNGDVGVVCFQTDQDFEDFNVPFRLVGGADESQGRVELYFKGLWGGICSNTGTPLGEEEANVICRTLGYTGGGSLMLGGQFGWAIYSYIDELQCNGDEDNLLKCSHYALTEPDGGGCGYHIGVQCYSPPSVCSFWGDPHLIGFAIPEVLIRGSCRHVLSTDNTDPAFATFTIAGSFDTPKLTTDRSFVRTVHVDFLLADGTTQGKAVLKQGLSSVFTVAGNEFDFVAGSFSNVPGLDGISATLDGDKMVYNFPNGIEITWDGIKGLDISMPAKFKGSLRGLCGDIDDSNMYVGPHDANNVMCAAKEAAATAGTTTADVAVYANSYYIPGDEFDYESCGLQCGQTNG